MRFGYYPGCSAEGSGVEYGLSTRKTAALLGAELVELDDWSCCGATSAHNTDKLLSLALPARNLAIAEKAGLGTVLAPCAACYNRHRSSEMAARHDAGLREKIEEIIEMDFAATTTTISALEWLDRDIGVEVIKSKVVSPLKGMKAACYYGCLLVRPVEHTGYENPEYPQSMDRVVNALGAQAIEWSFKTECCGAALATSRPEIGARMIFEVIRNAKEAGADCLVTACPLCMLNLDMRQAAALKAYSLNLKMPIYYITELVAIACGTSANEVGINRHFVEANDYLQSLPARAVAMEEEEARLAAERKGAKGKAKAKGEAVEEVAGAATAPNEEPAKNDKAAAEAVADQTTTGEDEAALQKKIDAMTKAWEKNPNKMAAKLIEDEQRAGLLAEIVQGDEKKTAQLAKLMITDPDKAAKAADAYVTGELKKRDKA